MRTGIAGSCTILLAAMPLASCDQQANEASNNAAVQVQPLQATDVAGKLAKTGLPVTNVVAVSAANDPDHLLGKPGQYTSKAMFSDGRHPHAGQSTIEVFASAADTMKRAEVVTSGAKDPDAITRYQMASGKVYLRLDEALPAAEAEQYRSAIVVLGL